MPELEVQLSHSRRLSHPDVNEPQPELSPISPEDGGNFRRSLQIDMKGLVGDAVGNVSTVDCKHVSLSP